MLETIWNENWIWLSGCLMSLGRIVLAAAGIYFCVGILHKQLEENEAVRLVVLGIFLFLAEYIIISFILFGIDSWGITTTLLIEAVINGGLYGKMSFRKGKTRERRRMNPAVRPYWPMFCICLAALLTAHNGNGFYGMQQDQGVYQTSAAIMLYGNGQNEKELTVYKKLSREDRKRYMQVVPTAINGFYFYDEDLEGLYAGEFTSDTAGYFHGIPTYPALLALWGGMFGLRHMGGIQVLIYMLLLSMGYLFLCDLGCRKGMASLGCGILAVSPMVLWVARSALTEMYLACALLAFLYFLARTERASIWLSAISVISFGCIHFSLYTLMPIVVLIYAGMYIRYRKRDYGLAVISVTAGFWFSANLTRIISTKYFYLNVVPLLDMFPWLSRENVMGFITVMCIAVLGAGIGGLILLPENSIARKKKRNESKYRSKRRSICRGGAFLIRILAAAWCVPAVVMTVKAGKPDGAGLASSCVSGFCVTGGVIMLPMALAGILGKPRILWKDRTSALTGVLFVYCVMFYSLVLRKEIPYYYYYGRYLVPFIPFVVWQGMQALLMLKGKVRIAAGIVLAAAQIVVLPYDLVLAAQRDDTRMSWEALEDICGIVTSEDVLIIEDDLLNVCYLPLTYMLQADVLPQMQYPPEKVMELYSGGEGETYYLSSGQAEIKETFTVLRNAYTVSEDNLSGIRGLLGLPVRMETERRYLQLDRRIQAKDIYAAGEDGWISMYEDSGFCWGCGSEYGLSVYLNSVDYRVHLQQGAAIPLARYGMEYYPVQVYVNGEFLQELKVYPEDGISEITFDLPARYIRNGENLLLFQSEPWTPQEYGEADYRELGISISWLWFETK